MTLKEYVDAKYRHFPEEVRKTILQAYLNSATRDPKAFDIDPGVESDRTDMSTTYKKEIFND